MSDQHSSNHNADPNNESVNNEVPNNAVPNIESVNNEVPNNADPNNELATETGWGDIDPNHPAYRWEGLVADIPPFIDSNQPTGQDNDDIKSEEYKNERYIKILKLFSAELSNNELFPILDKEFATFDINATDYDKMTLLHHTVTNTRYNIMGYLLEKGANPNVKDKHGETPLLQAARKSLLPHVQILIKYGANPDIYDKSNDSALLWAAYKGNVDIVIFLIENGACLRHTYRDGKDAIRWAIKGEDLETVKYLAGYLRDINQPDRNGNGIMDMNMTMEIRSFLHNWIEKNKLRVALHFKNRYDGIIDFEILREIFDMYH
jgi:ankyrin repeat protein